MFLTFDAQGQSGGFTVFRGNSQHVFPTSYSYASHSMAHSIIGAADIQPCGRNKGSYRALLGIGSSHGGQTLQRGWAALGAPVRTNRAGSPRLQVRLASIRRVPSRKQSRNMLANEGDSQMRYQSEFASEMRTPWNLQNGACCRSLDKDGLNFYHWNPLRDSGI
jgi:hypothetical protein